MYSCLVMLYASSYESFCRNIKDALYDKEIYDCIKVTVTRAKKSTRGGTIANGVNGAAMKSNIEEFEAFLEEISIRANGGSNQEIDAEAQDESDGEVEEHGEQKSQPVAKTASKAKKSVKQTKRSISRRKKSVDSDEDDAVEDDADSDIDLPDVAPKVKQSSTRSVKSHARKLIEESDESDGFDESDSENIVANKSKKTTRVRKGRISVESEEAEMEM